MTLFIIECRDSSLLLQSTVVSLPCEASTEAQTSDLELTRVSKDRFTAETANLAVGSLLIGSVSQGMIQIPLNVTYSKNCHPVLASESGIPLS